VVVATASPRRFVPRVHYRTSPGDRVVEVVSQFGRFDRSDKGFRLRSWLPDEGDPVPDDPASLAAAAAERVARHTSWPAAVSGPTVEKPVTAEEITVLRGLDPDGRYR